MTGLTACESALDAPLVHPAADNAGQPAPTDTTAAALALRDVSCTYISCDNPSQRYTAAGWGQVLHYDIDLSSP